MSVECKLGELNEGYVFNIFLSDNHQFSKYLLHEGYVIVYFLLNCSREVLVHLCGEGWWLEDVCGAVKFYCILLTGAFFYF